MDVKPRTLGATLRGMDIAYGGPRLRCRPARSASGTGPASGRMWDRGGGTGFLEAVMPWTPSSRCGSAPVPGPPHGRPRTRSDSRWSISHLGGSGECALSAYHGAVFL